MTHSETNSPVVLVQRWPRGLHRGPRTTPELDSQARLSIASFALMMSDDSIRNSGLLLRVYVKSGYDVDLLRGYVASF